MALLEGKRILLVDDEADIRELFKDVFESHGCEVIEASNGKDAFALVESQAIDIVLSDVKMPKGDGRELLKKIKARNPKNPLVFMITGHDDPAELEQLGQASAVFLKPVSINHVVAEIEKHLSLG